MGTLLRNLPQYLMYATIYNEHSTLAEARFTQRRATP
mgnify:CR=1 FL=1